jgi:hypothetical protein
VGYNGYPSASELISWTIVHLPPDKDHDNLTFWHKKLGGVIAHPNYKAALRWCHGPQIRGPFCPNWSGAFFFRDPKDAMAFKLAWG